MTHPLVVTTQDRLSHSEHHTEQTIAVRPPIEEDRLPLVEAAIIGQGLDQAQGSIEVTHHYVAGNRDAAPTSTLRLLVGSALSAEGDSLSPAERAHYTHILGSRVLDAAHAAWKGNLAHLEELAAQELTVDPNAPLKEGLMRFTYIEHPK